jgi:hypothetical protein
MIGPVSLIPRDTALPELFDSDGRMLLLPSSYYNDMGQHALQLWCHLHARYGVPTLEMIDWLSHEIGSRSAIEIGAGHGDLALYLGIPATDSWSQTFPDVKKIYENMRQPTIQYPGWVERLSAIDAMAKYRPQVVLASWVTQWADPDQEPPPGGGSMYGVREDELIASGITYILIGNISVHGEKKIMSQPHSTFSASWLRSRSAHPELNRIWIWNS